LAIDRRTTGKRLSEVLVDEGVLTKAQVAEASKYLRQPDDPLGPHLIRCGFITAWDLAKAVCTHFALPYLDLSSYKPKKDVVALLDTPFLHGYGVLPIDKFGKIITLAVCESISPAVLQAVVDRTHLSPYMYVAPYDKIRERLEEACPYEAPGGEAPAPADGEKAAEGAAPGSSEDGDWMAIFEEAEKKMKGSDDDVQLTEGSGKKDTE